MSDGECGEGMLAEGFPKQERLREILAGMRSAVVAFSGGVDSSLLLAVAVQEKMDPLVAVTIRSPVHPSWEVEEAALWVRGMGVRHRVVQGAMWEAPGFRANRRDRCYWCKRSLMGQLIEVARREGLAWVMEGSHAGDRVEDRPGMRALEELGIRSPLREAGLLKSEIRQWARALGIVHWDRPPRACLATRIPMGQRLTLGKLDRVDRAESVLRGLGFRQFRARHHGRSVRIQVAPDEVARLLQDGVRRRVIEGMGSAGFRDVWVDLIGYGGLAGESSSSLTGLDPAGGS